MRSVSLPFPDPRACCLGVSHFWGEGTQDTGESLSDKPGLTTVQALAAHKFALSSEHTKNGDSIEQKYDLQI